MKALAASLLALSLFASPAVPAAEDAAVLFQSIEAYMTCGREYAESAKKPTVAEARSKCAAALETYAKAMYSLSYNTMVGEGRSPDDAKTFAAQKEKEARAQAQTSFDASVDAWILTRS